MMKPTFPALAKIGRIAAHLRESERARTIGFGAFGALIFFLAFFELLSGVHAGERRLAAARAENAKVLRQVSGQAWNTRRDESRVVRATALGRLWPAETPGLAQAEFEKWIRESLAKGGVAAPQLQISLGKAPANIGNAEHKAVSGIQRMVAKVNFDFDLAALVALAADAADSNRLIAFERTQFKAGTNPRMEVELSAFIQLSDHQGAPKT